MPENLVLMQNRFIVKTLIENIISDYQHKMPIMQILRDIPVNDEQAKHEARRLL